MAGQTPKKMNVVQLTFIVTVNMMGSGIIMLPTNMAKVGAISLLSWVVTALGSMAMAYGFAQAGIYNQRPGGLAAYAEDAYGKDGYFQTFFLYFLSLAIANVAVAVSALGYLAGFFPGTDGDARRDLRRRHRSAVAHDDRELRRPEASPGASARSRCGASSCRSASWRSSVGSGSRARRSPRRGIRTGSASCRAWARASRSRCGRSSVSSRRRRTPPPSRIRNATCRSRACSERSVPASIYVLSTTAIQGVVPNADLQASTGSFGTAFAQMFNPTVGSIVMGLAVMACVGSLLGWQFTLGSVAKDAADTGMFPRIFGKVTSAGAPITGMVIMGVVQTLLAMMTISPDLSSQFAALVNLAVVTNVVPYILALSALTVILQSAGVGGGAYTRTIAITVVGIAYSVYALYASGSRPSWAACS